jgi:hypothetical protein
MARLRRTSTALEDSRKRSAGIKKFPTPTPLPAGLSITEVEGKQAALESLLDQYNGTLAEADRLLNQIQVSEKDLRKYDTKLLTAVGLVYGKDSSEYEMAGGKRESE